MSLIARSLRRGVVGRKFFSTLPESPKVAIAQHILLMKEIANAQDEAALSAVSSAGLPKIDMENLPKELEGFQSYFSLGSLGASAKFTPDPTAWQNMSNGDFAMVEVQRAETWPFFVGFM
jgi:hypothetical protein